MVAASRKAEILMILAVFRDARNRSSLAGRPVALGYMPLSIKVSGGLDQGLCGLAFVDMVIAPPASTIPGALHPPIYRKRNENVGIHSLFNIKKKYLFYLIRQGAFGP